MIVAFLAFFLFQFSRANNLDCTHVNAAFMASFITASLTSLYFQFEAFSCLTATLVDLVSGDLSASFLR